MSASQLGEFELIRRYFSEASIDASVALGIGDDCALLVPTAGEVLAVSIDTLVEGTHFLPGTPPEHLATRLLGAAVSDLAAMGAKPAWFTLALTLPESDPTWMQPFAHSLSVTSKSMGICLVGGDTTRGPLCLSAQVHGFVPAHEALTRQGAQPGDLVCVTGTLGDSRAGLESLLTAAQKDHDVAYLRSRFYAPQPRLQIGMALRGVATACIDISDGLLADLSHLLEGSGLGATLHSGHLPLSEPLCRYVEGRVAREWALSGGEDFELCFTVPVEKRSLLDTIPGEISVVGVVCNETGIRVDGQPASASLGYDHFPKDSE